MSVQFEKFLEILVESIGNSHIMFKTEAQKLANQANVQAMLEEVTGYLTEFEELCAEMTPNKIQKYEAKGRELGEGMYK